MKNWISVFVLIIISSAAFSQAKKPVTVKISTPTVQCGMCKDAIEKYMSRAQGVTRVIVDYRRKITTVTYLPDRTNIENVKAAIATVGYDADDVTAEEESYKKLPTCCKKPEDQK